MDHAGGVDGLYGPDLSMYPWGGLSENLEEDRGQTRSKLQPTMTSADRHQEKSDFTTADLSIPVLEDALHVRRALTLARGMCTEQIMGARAACMMRT
ncbi:hypothetical protein [Protofrankia symbiont of Coriaria ruscifolia]|uniref:hypothetical protein n=1 Tax=Protofrankia symbiont of Coriaria ruscifolia TaxID=1306542 RepID=UPI00104150CF|nr:hypothetical protein [Protofrankia symbiont of Coriaria ruscifolia]